MKTTQKVGRSFCYHAAEEKLSQTKNESKEMKVRVKGETTRTVSSPFIKRLKLKK